MYILGSFQVWHFHSHTLTQNQSMHALALIKSIFSHYCTGKASDTCIKWTIKKIDMRRSPKSLLHNILEFRFNVQWRYCLMNSGMQNFHSFHCTIIFWQKQAFQSMIYECLVIHSSFFRCQKIRINSGSCHNNDGSNTVCKKHFEILRYCKPTPVIFRGGFMVYKKHCVFSRSYFRAGVTAIIK